jgi:hypothetical protein
MRLSLFAFSGALFLIPTSLHAAEPMEAAWCRNGYFPSEQSQIGLAHAIGSPRTYFLWDGGVSPGCPEKGAGCRNRSNVSPGQEVLTSKSRNGFVCAFFPDRSGGAAGWVPESELAAEPVNATPALRAWTGKWLDSDNWITIKLDGASLAAQGGASYRGRTSVNFGAVESAAIPQGNHVSFSEGADEKSCHVKATLAGKYLVVSDDEHCGGMNVRFDGVYQRATPKPAKAG